MKVSRRIITSMIARPGTDRRLASRLLYLIDPFARSLKFLLRSHRIKNSKQQKFLAKLLLLLPLFFYDSNPSTIRCMIYIAWIIAPAGRQPKYINDI